jgi:hypothetical protein
MGGAFSHGQWQLCPDDELRRRFVRALRELFPVQNSLKLLDDELSFSLLDREGAGLVSEQALHDLVHQCGFKMERWQLLYLLARLDTDGVRRAYTTHASRMFKDPPSWLASLPRCLNLI